MCTLRNPVAGLVVMLAAVLVCLGALPGTLKAAPPDVSGNWNTSRGPAKLHQNGNLVEGELDGPVGIVHLSGHFDGSRILRLSVDGVNKDGSATLVVPSSATWMSGWVRPEGLPPFRWTWWR